MDVVDNNDFLENNIFSCIWLLETIFGFTWMLWIITCIWLLDVDVDNNDFLDVFHVFVVGNNILIFAWMLWIIMTSFSCIWLFGKQYLDFTWMLWIIMTSLMFFMYLVVENKIYILHGCCG